MSPALLRRVWQLYPKYLRIPHMIRRLVVPAIIASLLIIPAANAASSLIAIGTLSGNISDMSSTTAGLLENGQKGNCWAESVPASPGRAAIRSLLFLTAATTRRPTMRHRGHHELY